MSRINNEDKKDNENMEKTLKVNKLVTSMDVAKLAGVSQTSVSRVFNPESSRDVKQETRDKVLKAAKQLGYKPNFIARSMVSKKTNIIGIVIGMPIGPFNNEIIKKLTSRIQEHGKQSLMFTVNLAEDIDNILRRVLQYQVDGIIIASSALSKDMANLCIQNETPVILFNRFVPGLNASSVYCDNIYAGKSVAKFLIECGYKKIAHIMHKGNSASSIERKLGFYEILEQHNINNIMEEFAEYTYESGYNAAVRLLKQGNLPEVIFCTGDLIAIGAMDAAKSEFGLRVPEDIAFVGFDDIPMASWTAYKLTTVHQPIDELVDSTVEVLLKLIKNPKEGLITKDVKTTLVERNSTLRIK